MGLNYSQLLCLQRYLHDLRLGRVKQDGASSIRGTATTGVCLQRVARRTRTPETTGSVGAVVAADRGVHGTLINVCKLKGLLQQHSHSTVEPLYRGQPSY